MRTNGHIEQYLIEERNLNPAAIRENKVNQTQSNGVTLPDIGMFESPIYFISGWVILGLILVAIITVIRAELITLEPVHQAPCTKCRFFSSNPYLKCAVHPCIALTEQAINCADYWPQERKLFQ